MSGAHQQAARRLAALTQPEREWVLARLATADALRIRELMEPASAPEPAPAPEPVETAPAPLSDEEIVERAAPGDVLRLLQEEPDWFIALVLARRRWPWDREVLASLDAARFDELGLLAWRAGEGAKARAGEAALGLLAAKLRELAAPPAAASAFDQLLAGMS